MRLSYGLTSNMYIPDSQSSHGSLQPATARTAPCSAYAVGWVQSEMSVLSYAMSYNKQKGEIGVILVGRLELCDTAMG